MSQKAKMGGWPQRAPIGYLNQREKTGGKEIARIILDAERAFLVKEAFRLYATGDYSLSELHGAMEAKGLTSIASKSSKPPVMSKLAEMLVNPFYIGIVEWNGVRYQGQHKALITQSLFDKVQEVLRLHDKAGVRDRTHDHYLKGLLHCGQCGRRLSLTLAKGTYLYFYCLGQKNALRKQTNCTQPYVMTCDAEVLIENLYKRVQIPPEWVPRLETELEEEIVSRQAIASEQRVTLTKRLSELADEREKLLRAYYSNAIPLELLKKDQDRIGFQEASARAELTETESDLAEWQEVLSLAIRLAANCHDAYIKARPKVRRRFNEAVLKTVYIRNGKVKKTEFNEPFDVVFSRPSSNKRLSVEAPGFEPSWPYKG